MSHSSNRALGRDYVTLLLISRPLTVAAARVCGLLIRTLLRAASSSLHAWLDNGQIDEKRWTLLNHWETPVRSYSYNSHNVSKVK